jgi:putative esterase
MTKYLAALAGALMSATALAQPACVTSQGAMPAGANSTDKAAPFFIDPTGLDFKTAPPTRDPHNPNYPKMTELGDGTLPYAGAEGNFVLGPTHTAAPETTARDGVPKGKTITFTMSSKDSTIYNPGLIRDDPPNCPNGSINATTTAPGDKSNLIVTTSHPGTWTRDIIVYVPEGYAPGTELPFLVYGDGPSNAWKDLATILDNLIQQKRVPPMIAIGIGAGGQDAQGAQRGKEYDAVSGVYTQFIEREVLPLVEKTVNVKLTKNPEGRATMGLSSSGAAAFTMAWFYPELYHRVLAYSPTMTNQQWPHDPSMGGGAWEYHSAWTGKAGPHMTVNLATVSPSTEAPGTPLIPSSPTKPIRFWFEAGDQDLFYPNPAIPDGMHDWTLASTRMAQVLAAKGYHYQFLFAKNAKHVDRPTVGQTLPAALEWLWKGYPSP